jgi:hypothetical protein
MFNTPVEVPNQISTLELSKIWLYKAFQNLERELEAETKPEESSAEDDN